MACGAMGLMFKFVTIDENIVKPKFFGLTNKFETTDAAIETVINNAFYLDKIIEMAEREAIEHLNRAALLTQRQQQNNANAVFKLTPRLVALRLLRVK